MKTKAEMARELRSLGDKRAFNTLRKLSVAALEAMVASYGPREMPHEQKPYIYQQEAQEAEVTSIPTDAEILRNAALLRDQAVVAELRPALAERQASFGLVLGFVAVWAACVGLAAVILLV